MSETSAVIMLILVSLAYAGGCVAAGLILGHALSRETREKIKVLEQQRKSRNKRS